VSGLSILYALKGTKPHERGAYLRAGVWEPTLKSLAATQRLASFQRSDPEEPYRKLLSYEGI
jgi:hypothetical protein